MIMAGVRLAAGVLLVSVGLVGCKSSSAISNVQTTTSVKAVSSTTKPPAPATTTAKTILSTAPTAPTSPPASVTETVPPTTAAPTEPPPTTSPPTVPPTTAEVGTRSNPVPLGSTFSLGDYINVSLGSIEVVPFAKIKAANEFNEAPPDGQAYVRVKLTATYNGSDTGNSFDFYSLGLVGDKGTIYDQGISVSDGSGPSLDKLDSANKVIQGGILTGYIYYLIDTSDTHIEAIWHDLLHDQNQFIAIS